MKPELKKLLVLNLPYLLFVYLFVKCGQAYRLAAGADASAKLLHLTSGISAAFANPLPSLHPFDLCVGVVGAVAVRLIVYSKGKNTKKYRKGEEYGSARWGTVVTMIRLNSKPLPLNSNFARAYPAMECSMIESAV